MAGRKVKDWPESERPRERLINNGPEVLSDAQLLAIILRTGSGRTNVMELSISLLEKFRSLKNIDTASVPELSETDGLGIAKIAQLKAAFELGKRMMADSKEDKPLLNSSGAVYSCLGPGLRHIKKEKFICLMLDAKNRLLREHLVSEGTLTNSMMHPREAFKEAIKESAASVIFVHNHPSGDPTPSKEDIAVTERLKNTGNIVGITVLDHVIIGDGKYVSLKEQGLL
ncbi:MAG: JAB domain-containing protein [Nitrospirae bacterium]|nr:MAG: JAB domain-containing protein [Nitrospirota bacterium]